MTLRHLSMSLAAIAFITPACASGVDYGQPNPKAPAEFSQFSFLIGEKICEGEMTRTNRDPYKFKATWTGRYVLDGRAIMDEFRMNNREGESIRIGANIRTYHPEQGWVMKWVDGIDSSWMDLSPTKFGKTEVTDEKIQFKTFFDDESYFMITITERTPERFVWRGESFDLDGTPKVDGDQVLICTATGN